MRRKPPRPVCRSTALVLFLALVCLASALRLLPPDARASTINVHYEDNFDDVHATEETAAAVKAAFLLRFPDFVSWKNAPGDTLRIGVSADSALLGTLSQMAEAENQSGLGAPYKIHVTRVENSQDVRHCDILVLGDDTAQEQQILVGEAHQSGTLTVGVWDEPHGETIIRLYREGSRVRFDISQTLAKEAGLLISSKLLNLAREQSSRVVANPFEPARG